MGRTAKGPADENFPVGSWLLARDRRPHVAAFYAFARTADDVADDPDLPAAAKLDRLDRMAAALVDGGDGDVGDRLRRSLAAAGVPAAHALDLLDAFRQDARQARHPDWASLMAYCDRSAAPVGRFLLDLHGEARARWPAADALCAALQVLNHLQDLGADRRRLDRVYLPQDWLVAAGAGDRDLDRLACTPALRRVVDRCLDGVDGLLRRSRPLAAGLADRRLAAEAAVIQCIAERLSRALRAGDPLARPVRLGRGAYGVALLVGLGRAFGDRAFRRGVAGAAARPAGP
ncbi:squalene synthase HpnC [Stella sp.]|uniref:squalene synthase HpnC n=1 Tax=Stella sp. TaxID=2912054 RepID=UPI0035B201BA